MVPEGHEPAPNRLPRGSYQNTRLRVPERGTLRLLEIAFIGAAIQEYYILADAAAGSGSGSGIQYKTAKSSSGWLPPSGRNQESQKLS